MTNFEIQCHDAAQRFLRTVTIIDNEVSYEPQSNQVEKYEVIDPTASFSERTLPVDVKSQKEPSFAEGDELSTHVLNAQVVIDSFADLGIVCCIQRPTTGSGCVERAVNLAKSTDVLIIDWDLDKENKQLARDILKAVMQADQDSGGRERLLIVYSAQNNPDSMLKDLVEDVQTETTRKPRVDKERYVICERQLRLVILNKERTAIPPRGSRIVPFEELPKEVILEFSKLAGGIIPTATLNVISALRERTHQLLGILNSRLDGAFCHHRALLEEPADCADFALELITSEIQTVLKGDEKARKCVDRSGVKSWFDSRFGEITKFHFDGGYSIPGTFAWKMLDDGSIGDQQLAAYKVELATGWLDSKTVKGKEIINCEGQVLSSDDATALIKKGRFADINGCSPPNVLNFVQCFFKNPKSATEGCLEMAGLHCTSRDSAGRTHFRLSQTPVLELGTVFSLRKRQETEYFLCLQPLCDTVRLKGFNPFLFLKLAEGNGKQFDIVIRKEGGNYLKFLLRAPKVKSEFVSFKFCPVGESDRISAKKWRGEFRFHDVHENSFKWEGELRREKAQQIANYQAANSARVGIDEFEWMRRQSGR